MTLAVTGHSSVLEVQYFSPFELSTEKHHVLGLIELLTCNSIPNIDATNNQFRLVDIKSDNLIEYCTIPIPTGSYEIEDIKSYPQRTLPDVAPNFNSNNNELCCEIECKHAVDFTAKNSIEQLLGFC